MVLRKRVDKDTPALEKLEKEATERLQEVRAGESNWSFTTRQPVAPHVVSPVVLFFFFFFFFSTGLVRLYIAGLPLRSCCTIGAPSVQGSAQCAFFRFWLQQDSNPRPGAFHADVLPLRNFDPPMEYLGFR